MKFHGNRFSTSFVYSPRRSSNKLTYGKNTLFYAGSEDSSNYFELGYNSSRVDAGTRIIFYTPDGFDSIEELPFPTFTYTPSMYSGGLANIDDVPIFENSQNITWPEDDYYGVVYKGEGYSSTWHLGPYNKAVWFGEEDSFLFEIIIKVNVNDINAWDLFNIGFNETNKCGMLFQRSSQYNFTFKWGDGTNINQLDAVGVIPDPAEFIHVAVIKSYQSDKISIYVNGEEADSVNSPNSVYHLDLYNGTATPYMLKDLDAEVSYARIAVGEYTPADFAYSFYFKDGNDNYKVAHYPMTVNYPYCIQANYQAGGVYKIVDVFNTYGDRLSNYHAEIDPGFSDPNKVYFEDFSGKPLPFIHSGGSIYVEIPNIIASGTYSLKALYRNYDFDQEQSNVTNVLEFPTSPNIVVNSKEFEIENIIELYINGNKLF